MGIRYWLMQANLFLLDVDFEDQNVYEGDSYWGFLGFVLSLAAIMLIFIGIIKRSTAKRQWNLFYDDRDRKDLSKPEYKKEAKQGTIFICVGIACLVVSFLILDLPSIINLFS